MIRKYRPKNSVQPRGRIGAGEKRNPNTLRDVIRSFRLLEGVSVTEFARRLSAAWQAAEDYDPEQPRYGKRSITPRAIRKIEQDKDRIEYWHLEMYANFFDVPSGVILLISRYISELEHLEAGGPDRRSEIRGGVPRLISGLDKLLTGVKSEEMGDLVKAISALLAIYKGTAMHDEQGFCSAP